MIEQDLIISKEVFNTLRRVNGQLCFHSDGSIKLKIGRVELAINKEDIVGSKIELATLLQAVKDSFDCERRKSLFNILRRILNGQAAKDKKPE